MDEKKLAKIKREIEAARGRLGNLRHNDLAKIAKMLGRERSAKRTNEPTYESALLNANVITIPDHARGLNKWTAKAIINQLDEDVVKFEAIIRAEKGERIIYADDECEN